MKIIDENIIVPNAFIAIVISRYNTFINKNLLYSTIDTLQRIGMVQDKNITICWVPGSYEIASVINLLIQKNIYDGIIAIGTIIKGETSHFKYLSQEVCSQISSLSVKNNIPISFSILTTNNIKQAIERSGIKKGNRGTEAALTLLEMINIFKAIKLLHTKNKKEVK
ncbi:6,7-dimethyl-8-ribityllumazine synthase [Enterobacteriaceae endosymbiont of Donacia bicoloricornis]|uniref:6,7-dimethyl-8-ribityllumazine synthase n=1 Tax=Enterobacteriaceae endosymbiont of Donacia bicoloricornis TaxID=2675772 RepID=UPI001448AA1E|nr:6,7-dimethyl-8-ribityllumazine synthase [Enterobacteriaceae endosymbiont of Donacia bicoloricornis]QJC37588.1 6,7-dimethyl-8-ribityllumazine synthase [Enterobacteriaceae endosymbiont of Donacia bicoloricornis]